MCRGNYVLILNPDTILKTDTIRLLASYLETHLDVGAVGPKRYFEDGSPHVSFNHHWTILDILIWRIGPHGKVRNLYDRFSTYQGSDVLFISGTCFV